MARPSRNPQHGVQDHNPNRTLRSHVVQSRPKHYSVLYQKLGPYQRTKAEMAEDLRRAVEATSGPHPEQE